MNGASLFLRFRPELAHATTLPLLLARLLTSILIVVSLGFSQPFVIHENNQTSRGLLDFFNDPNRPTRQRIDLSGQWSASIAEGEWHDIKVPSSIEFEGQITFLRKFSIPREIDPRSAFSLVALGIAGEAEIYVNDAFVGKHVGGMTSFRFDIPASLLTPHEENEIKILTSNRLNSSGSFPPRKQVWGWRNYAGLIRDLYLVASPPIHLDRTRTLPRLSDDLKQGTVRIASTISFTAGTAGSVETELKPAVKSLQVILELLDDSSGAIVASQQVNTEITAGRDAEIEGSLLLNNPKQWSTEIPSLYRLRTSVFAVEGKQRELLDVQDQLIGFAHVTVDRSALLVNRQKVTIRGINWIEESAFHGASLRYDEMEKDVLGIKALGANAIRFTFRPPHPYMIELCSRYGLFALVELPVWNASESVLASEAFQNSAELAAVEMVQRDRAMPSVLAWGIGHEFDTSTPVARGFVERIRSLIREHDDRPVYLGSFLPETDLCTGSVDLAALSIMINDTRRFKDVLNAWKKRHANKPVLVLKYGRIVESGNRSGYSDPLSEQAQARYLQQMHAVVKDAGIAGGIVMAYADWHGDRPLMTVRQDDRELHPVGIVDLHRQKRIAYDALKALYSGQKMGALQIGTHKSSFPVAHILSGFVVIIVLAYFYHYNRRFSDTFKRALTRSYNFFADLRDLRSVSAVHTVIVALATSLTMAVVVSGLLYHFRTSAFADYLLTQICLADGLKTQLVRAAWAPLEGILAFSGIFFFTSILFAVLVKVFSMLVRTKISYFHAYTVAAWGALPLVFLSPVGMSMLKVLSSPAYILPVFGLIAVMTLWAGIRILKGISVIYDLTPLKLYSAALVVVLAVLVGAFLYLDANYAVGANYKFVFNVLRGQG